MYLNTKRRELEVINEEDIIKWIKNFEDIEELDKNSYGIFLKENKPGTSKGQFI
ncbi:hypothetical protein [Dethiothermospora halolimnae]|uniref:hypothetical protein n=1 Tax=Dethiothermospora halolimnae TaxID=3114390 RepID=UPI003CCC2EB3